MATDRIIKTITVFDDFCHAKDPDEGHDTGAAVTVRVITVMLADEY